MRHLLSIEDLTAKQIGDILALAKKLKAARGKRSHPQPLKGQMWALIFAKYSTRTSGCQSAIQMKTASS